jgi:L-ascorbate metabolism protein UlaG (beta-lactamase superfamily)
MPKLLYQGHGSFRLTTDQGRILYVDPYAGEGYTQPADLILVTHQHGDHNQTSLCPQKPACQTLTNREALAGGRLGSFTPAQVPEVQIQAVKAQNKNHSPAECVGYLITIDGKTLYAAGDTSTTDQMPAFAALHLDYALLPCDGIYNMDLPEAAACAQTIAAQHNIPIHIKPGALFDRARAEQWTAPNRLIVEPGEEIEL